jgi:hypothetical protein
VRRAAPEAAAHVRLVRAYARDIDNSFFLMAGGPFFLMVGERGGLLRMERAAFSSRV